MRMTARRWLAALCCLALAAVACTDDADPPSAGSPTSEAPSTTTVEVPTTEPAEVSDDELLEVIEDRPPDPEPDDTPLEIDDDIRIGVLDNGLTYYVRENDRPGSSVSLRLVIRAGGLQEDPRGTGIAHFLEHMMFNGTEKYPGNELDAALRSIGAEIGPDFNAYTSDTETVYQLAIADFGDNVEIAFDVLAEWAARATIDPGEVAAEAPIVREELRVRGESGQGLIFEAFEEAYFAGTPFEGVDVAGSAESIEATTAEVLRSYYDTWYRPDNMAIIAVGDRDVDDLEREIVDRFSELEPRGQVLPAEIPEEFDLRTEPLVEVIVEPSFPDSFISVDFPVPAWKLDTVGGNELWLTEVLLGLMIDNRLVDGVDSGRLDLRRGFGGWFPHNRYLHYMGFNVDADDLEAGTEVLMTELRGTLLNGFTERELDQARETMLAWEEQRPVDAETAQDDDLADTLVEAFLSGADLRPVDDLAADNTAFLEGLTLDEVNEHWRWILTSSAPIVLVVGPDADRVGDAANHVAAVERAAAATVGAVDDDVVEIDALMDPPAPVTESARRDLSRNRGFELEFDNGMRVLFSPSDIEEDQVLIASESPGGRAMLDADDGAVAPVVADAVGVSGLGGHSAVQVRRFLADADVGLSAYIADASEGFSGGAAADDLELLFQLLHLATVEPAVEAVQFAQQVEFARDLVAEAELDPGLAADVLVSDSRTGGGPLAAAPTLAQLDELDADRALAIYLDRFDRLDDHVIVVVGDVDDDVVIDLARRYVGTLPAAAAVERPVLPAPAGEIETDTVVGSTGVGAYRLWITGEADETIANRVLAELATSLVNDRGFSVIREELGATYGGFAYIEFEEPGDGVELYVTIDGDPSRLDEIDDAVSSELASLASGDISADDLAEARAVLSTRYEFITNGYIAQSLFDEAYESDDRVIDRRRQIDALEDITADDVAEFLSLFTDSENRIEVTAVPG